MVMSDIRKGDGVVLKDGSRGIVFHKPFQMTSADYRAIGVSFDWLEGQQLEMPIQLIAVAEVWRDGQRIDTEPQLKQLEMF